MDIQVSDYEKLGKFYLGRPYDIHTKEMADDLVLYDSRDLVTHGVVMGMTGSGKTGLCLALLEEAAMDGIPAIVIDPKGDIPNLMLQFPNLLPSDFRPWINEDDAERKGMTPDDYAAKQAELWKTGLAEWGQDEDRIRRLHEKVDINIFTPGSRSGIPVSILSSLDAPDEAILDDHELFSERIESTVSSLLALMGINADPLQSKEHILISNIFSTCWQKHESLSLASLIGYIQSPPFSSIGVVAVNEFFVEKKRQDLAMRLNSLLASPGFSAWLKGVPLDMNQMMRAPDGRARISIFSIAHLGDTERMFFVSLLLNQMLGWMRAQSGTTSLRALLYMDEIYGYLPPTANPPSKKPMLMMLKQGRAFGLGLLLATQNPVDLDYKALSNIGTWFLGRMQTERDKARVLDGLEGAAAGARDAKFSRSAMDELLSSLATRVFVMNNVNQAAPLTFQVRWAMSYLRGPLARDQIKLLMDPKRDQFPITEHQAGSGDVQRSTAAAEKIDSNKPVVASKVDEYFLPVAAEHIDKEVIYLPAVIRAAEVRYSDAKLGINGGKSVIKLNRLDESSSQLDPAATVTLPETINLTHFQRTPSGKVSEWGGLPGEATDTPFYTTLRNEFADWLQQNEKLPLWSAPVFRLISKPGEAEGDFRGRLQHAARELRDVAVAELERQFEKKIAAAHSALDKAEARMDEQAAQSNAAKISTAMTIGSTILSFVLGGRSKGISATKARSATSGATRVWKEGQDVERSKEEMRRLEDNLHEVEAELAREVEKLKVNFDATVTPLEPVQVEALKKNIVPKACGLAWLPYLRKSQFELQEAWY
jgi:hypothetical protein